MHTLHPALVFILGLVIGALVVVGSAGWAGDTASIGGTAVRQTTSCQEDELIGFIGVDLLGCIHYEEVN